MKSSIVVANTFWHMDEPGGAYKVSTDFASHLSKKGYDTHYICMGRQKDLSVGVERGVRVWRYPFLKRSENGKSLLNFIGHLKEAGRAAQSIARTLPKNGRVILNGHGGLQYLGALNKLPRGMILRKVMSVHSPMDAEYRAERMGSAWTAKDFFVSKLLSMTERRCYSSSDVVQCDSRFTQSLLKKNFSGAASDRSVVCPGYVDTKKFFFLNQPKQKIREGLDHPAWKTDHTVFFCLRRHVRRMGIDNLIRAAAWLRDKDDRRREFRVIIGGDGPLRGTFEKMAVELKLENHVFFLGRVPEQNLASYYQGADCFVLPTRSLECFGLVVLEAFACGTPVIATPVGAIPEVLGAFGRESLAAGSGAEDIGRSMLDFLDAPRMNHEELRQHAETFEMNRILDQLEGVVVGLPEAER